jgi:hypothetical protein
VPTLPVQKSMIPFLEATSNGSLTIRADTAGACQAFVEHLYPPCWAGEENPKKWGAVDHMICGGMIDFV